MDRASCATHAYCRLVNTQPLPHPTQPNPHFPQLFTPVTFFSLPVALAELSMLQRMVSLKDTC